MPRTKKDQWVYPFAKLHHIVDGDTFYATVSRELDFGYDMLIKPEMLVKYRLNRVAAAKSTELVGLAATTQLQLLLSRMPFTLHSVGRYKFGGEWMAECVLDDGMNVSDFMIQNHYAEFWDGRGVQPVPVWPRPATPRALTADQRWVPAA